MAIGSAYVKSNIGNLSDEDFRRYVKEGLKGKMGETPTPMMISFQT